MRCLHFFRNIFVFQIYTAPKKIRKQSLLEFVRSKTIEKFMINVKQDAYMVNECGE